PLVPRALHARPAGSIGLGSAFRPTPLVTTAVADRDRGGSRWDGWCLGRLPHRTPVSPQHRPILDPAIPHPTPQPPPPHPPPPRPPAPPPPRGRPPAPRPPPRPGVPHDPPPARAARPRRRHRRRGRQPLGLRRCHPRRLRPRPRVPRPHRRPASARHLVAVL